MLSCWHDLLFLFCLLLFYLFLPSMGWLCVVGVFGLIECPHSLPALHSGLHNNNNNNNNIGIYDSCKMRIMTLIILFWATDSFSRIFNVSDSPVV